MQFIKKKHEQEKSNVKDKEYAEKEHNHACNSRKTPIYFFKDLTSLEDRSEFLQKDLTRDQ